MFPNPRPPKRRKGNPEGLPFPWSENAIRRKLTEACAETGVARWTPHDLRHWANTEYLKLCNGDTEAVRAVTGHDNLESTRHYDHAHQGAQGLVEKMADVLGGEKETQGPRQTESAPTEEGSSSIELLRLENENLRLQLELAKLKKEIK